MSHQKKEEQRLNKMLRGSTVSRIETTESGGEVKQMILYFEDGKRFAISPDVSKYHDMLVLTV